MSCMHSSRAPFLADNKPLSRAEGESTRETKKNDCLFAMHARAHILCVCVCESVLLKIDSGISRALFIAEKTFNPFNPGCEQRDV